MTRVPQASQPPRDPDSHDGFYVKQGLCLGCCMTHEEAPDLMEHSAGGSCSERCRFKKQPQTQEQLMRAVKATHVSCSRAVRYGGTDPEILKLLVSYGLHDQCDQLRSPPEEPSDPSRSEP